MKLIAGLGNPGRQYENTRHNIGFRVAEELGRRWGIEINRQRFSGYAGSGRVGDQQVWLLKPATFMNLSGRSVREAVEFYRLPLEDLLVITDDLALPLGRLRIRARGSAGGHNGLSSIIGALGTEDFARLRIGIEWVEGGRMVSHVLGTFSPQEAVEVAQVVARAADAAESWLAEGVTAAMNKFNKPEGPSGQQEENTRR